MPDISRTTARSSTAIMIANTRSCTSRPMTMESRPQPWNVPQECLHGCLPYSCGCKGARRSAQATLKSHTKRTFQPHRSAVNPANHMGRARQNHAARCHAGCHGPECRLARALLGLVIGLCLLLEQGKARQGKARQGKARFYSLSLSVLSAPITY